LLRAKNKPKASNRKAIIEKGKTKNDIEAEVPPSDGSRVNVAV
jgi:hypothetical protein